MTVDRQRSNAGRIAFVRRVEGAKEPDRGGRAHGSGCRSNLMIKEKPEDEGGMAMLPALSTRRSSLAMPPVTSAFRREVDDLFDRFFGDMFGNGDAGMTRGWRAMV